MGALQLISAFCITSILAGPSQPAGCKPCGRSSVAQFEKDKAIYAGDGELISSDEGLEFDRYKGTELLMPFAKGVSAKSHDFDEDGNEVHTDFVKMMQIVIDSGYDGHIGIEYEGSKISEDEGVKKTKTLLERSLAAVSA